MSLHDFIDRHQGESAYVIGKGPTLDLFLEKPEGSLLICVNEAALVVRDPTYFFAHDGVHIANVADPLRHIAAAGDPNGLGHMRRSYPPGCVAIVREEHKDLAIAEGIPAGSVYTYRKAQEKKALLGLNAQELAASGELYGESCTTQSALHFAKLCGCREVVMVGIDGGFEYAKCLGGMGLVKGTWYDKNRGDTCRILQKMGMPFRFWREPDGVE
jgi:hypothetical protein